MSERVQRQVDRLLDEAEQAVGERDWAAVGIKAGDALTLDPGNADAAALVAAAERGLAGSPVGTPAGRASPPQSEPTSFASGRYRVRRFLGEGGKKRVYLAHDSLLDREVAFALIKTEGLDQSGRERIQREAQAMGRLGSHPHVVTVFDLGEDQGQPFMVTELMDGGDVQGLIGSAPGGRIPLERALEIARSVCRGLEFAHSRGLVHRDLKPGNVWLTADGVAKVGDFGLALALDRSRLTQEGTMVGTVSYMPPEQALGGAVGPRSDLYSLGAMLYELVTGRPPFVGDDVVSIIGQHINTPPVQPCWHCPACPRPLEALILRLLAKDPAERPDSAADVLAALEAIDLVQEQAEMLPVAEEARALDALASGVFVGRQREMGELKAALEDALSGHGRLLMLVGEPGIGKTRTALELATYAGLRQAQVLWGRCYEGEGAPPYWSWVQVIRSYVREHEQEQLRSELGSGAGEIAEVVSEVHQRLPGLERPPDTGDPRQARFRLFDAIASFLKSAGRSQPLVLILDDLHWADAGSLLLLEFVARELSDARLLLLGTYRDVELSRQHPLSRTLAEFTREHLLTRVPLRGLSPENVGRFIEATSSVAPPEQLVAAVHEQTEGNPLFVTEVVRLLVEEEALGSERLAERDSWSVRIPEGVREVIGRRLDRLSDRCNETLTVAAVLGRAFTLEQLTRLVEGISEDRLLELLEEALAARVIEEPPDAVGRYQFTHALIRETLEDELSSTRRARLHARIAQVLEELYGDEATAHAAELAYHYGEAEPILGAEKLVPYLLYAGERALAARGYEEAVVHFERALAAKERAPMDTQTAELLFGLGRAQVATVQTHELETAVGNLIQAFDYYADTRDADRAVAVATYPLPPSWALGYTKAGEMVTRASTMVEPGSEAEGRVLSAQGWFLGRQGDYERATHCFERALEISRRHGDLSVETRTLVNTAHIDWLHFRLANCVGRGLRAIELAAEAHDHLSTATAKSWVTRALIALGEREEAHQHGASALALAEQLHHAWWLAIAYGNLALLSACEGDWADARVMSDAGLEAAPRDPRILAVRALMEYEVGDFATGRAYIERLREAADGFAPPGPAGEHAFVAASVALTASVSGVLDLFDVAETAAQGVLAAPQVIVPGVVAVVARTSLALIAAQRKDTGDAAAFHDALEPQKAAGIPFLSLPGDRVLGLLAATMGQLDLAAAHFEDALAFCRRSGYRPELAWTASDYADALDRRRDAADTDRAARLREEALELTRQLGMRPLMERILGHRPILKA